MARAGYLRDVDFRQYRENYFTDQAICTICALDSVEYTQSSVYRITYNSRVLRDVNLLQYRANHKPDRANHNPDRANITICALDNVNYAQSGIYRTTYHSQVLRDIDFLQYRGYYFPDQAVDPTFAANNINYIQGDVHRIAYNT